MKPTTTFLRFAGSLLLAMSPCAQAPDAVTPPSPRAAAMPIATRTVAGRVVDLLGDGLPNARVWVTEQGLLEPALREMRTDGSGWFRLAGVPDRPLLRFHALADAHCRVAVSVPRDGSPLLLRLPEAAVLTGVVRNTRRALAAGVEVWAQPIDGSPGICARTTTDAQGAFVLPGVALGHNRVFAWVPDSGLATCELRVEQDGEVQLDVGAEPKTTWTVTVPGLTAEERAGALLRGGYEGVESLPEQPAPFVVRGLPEGPLHLPNLPDVRTLLFVESAWLRFEPAVVTLEEGAGPHASTFAVRRATGELVDVRARLVDVDGKPVAGVPLALYGVLGQPPQRGISAADGTASFRTQREAAQQPVLLLEGEDWLFDRRAQAKGLTERVGVEPNPATPVELRVVRGGVVRGRLLLADGSPAQQVAVLVERLPPTQDGWRSVRVAYTEPTGEFVLGGLPITEDAVRMRVQGPSGSLLRELVLPAPGAELHLGELALAAPAVVEGIVRLPDDTQAIGARVVLRVPASPLAPGRSGYVAETSSDARGRFRFVGVPPGTVAVTAWPSAKVAIPGPSPIMVEAGQRVVHDLVLPRR
ncbi:MAG: hypothetical protein ACK501_06375 [Planctomycetota bacterium]